MAYTALDDAARKAIAAHMLANGLRAPARMGAHEAVGIYAEEAIPDPTGSITEFQKMRAPSLQPSASAGPGDRVHY